MARAWQCSSRRRKRDATQQGADTGFEFCHRKRFGQVVVGSEVETVHPVLYRIARRKHQHVGCGVTKAKTAKNFEAVDIGQPDVEHDQVVGRCAQRPVRLHTCLGHIDGVSGAGQDACQPLREQRVVFDNENAHCLLLSRGGDTSAVS